MNYLLNRFAERVLEIANSPDGIEPSYARSGMSTMSQAPTTNPLVLTLPTELLLEIFSLTLMYTPTNFRETRTTAPWNIGAACHRWRNVVLASPELWGYISLEESIHRNLSRAEYRLLNEMLNRATGGRKTIQYSGRHPMAFCRHLLRHGVDLTSLLVKLELDADYRQIYRRKGAVQTLAASVLPCLEIFTLVAEGMPRMVGFDSTFVWPSAPPYSSDDGIFFLQAPVLRELHLHGVSLGGFPARLEPIRRISFDFVQEIDLNVFLKSGFEEASIVSYSPMLPEPIEPAPVPTLDALLKLSLHSHEDSCGIERFHAPNLRALHVHECRPAKMPWDHLSNFVPYSPLLETLNLDANAGTVHCIIGLLQHCPRLKTFSFAVDRPSYTSERDYLDWIWDALTLNARHSDLVPALERLYVQDETYREPSTPDWMCMLERDSLVHMISSRKDTLKRLVLRAPYAMFKTRKWDEVVQEIEAVGVESGFEFEHYWGYRHALCEDGEAF
ncbi:hypothetical protein CYLTODRAFT_485552 [Cylindrobasidium torrendii FP15055 ss-10]|uniref:Uncharacterized protein n=1 Tax=Cylindrobasidium torrendii FP15055 ss-10 TaxID=1314674 RepID=A0A0D7BS85_9AGAR|nr:hypothetical protein CYLTODRAFT_485552 [Cylindrobasidium torrendii FP15055 ss-10]